MPIRSPRCNTLYEERDMDCQEALEIRLLQLLDDACGAGWSQAESMQAIECLIRSFRDFYGEDFDLPQGPVCRPD